MQMMKTRKRVLRQEHSDTLISMINLTSIYRNQERQKKIERLELQMIKTRKRVLKQKHSVTLISMNSLALTYQSQER